MAEEYFDIFDAALNPAAPFKMERKETHKTGAWHQTFDCWVLRRDPSGNKIVLQLRSADKDSYPSTFDISASGHLLAGEKPEDGVREIEEELGLKVDYADLIYLGIYKEAVDTPGRCVRHHSHTYLYETAQPLSAYKPQESELDGVFEVNITDGLRLFREETAAIDAVGLIKEGRFYKPATRQITIADMAAYEDRCKVTKYYLKIFALSELYFRNYRNLVV
jgi:isopentenyldiphosphate isomerase